VDVNGPKAHGLGLLFKQQMKTLTKSNNIDNEGRFMKYAYYKVDYKLLTPMLGTCTEASIYKIHVLEKAKKLIAKSNRLAGRLTKVQAKYAGTEIPERKELADLQGIIRATQEALGKKELIPETMDELLAYAKELNLEYEEAVAAGEAQKATVFMRGTDGKVVLSSHMVIGNLKENLKIITNNSSMEERIIKSKAAVSEVLSLDVKPVEDYMYPNTDIVKDEKGERALCERPISFDVMGKRTTAIALSEELPAGTEFGVTLRVRAESPLRNKLPDLLSLGRSNGFGAWRGSGRKGSYVYKIEELPNYKEVIPKGWN